MIEGTVFISHSSRDRKVAETLCEALEQRGIGCWLSSRNIRPGQNFQEAIVQAVQGAKVMLLVFSSNANNSDEIKKELALASQSRLAVIPVRVEDVMPNDAFRYEFATRQWIDVFKDWETAVGELADYVRATVDGLPPADPKPTRPPTGKSSRLGWSLAAGVAVLVLVAGAAYTMQRQTPKSASPGMEAAAADISGTWQSGEIANVYDANDKFTIVLKLKQNGAALTGRVIERRSSGDVDKQLHDGRVDKGSISFTTRGEVLLGSDTHPVIETYEGTLDKETIEFVRQNDVETGGLPEKFVARRK